MGMSGAQPNLQLCSHKTDLVIVNFPRNLQISVKPRNLENKSYFAHLLTAIFKSLQL